MHFRRLCIEKEVDDLASAIHKKSLRTVMQPPIIATWQKLFCVPKQLLLGIKCANEAGLSNRLFAIEIWIVCAFLPSICLDILYLPRRALSVLYYMK